MSFVHLHVHTQYSILDGLSSTKGLFAKAASLGMPAVAITDHGNMYGVKEFIKASKDFPDVKPIIGCEVYVTQHYDHLLKDKDHRSYYHLILLAKNERGYKNLLKIVSEGHVNGMYYKPRVSHEVIAKYHEDLICCSACLAGEIPRKIVAGDMKGAEESIMWFKNLFGEDYYLEVQLHKTEVQGLTGNAYDKVWEVYNNQLISNEGIFALAEKTGVKVIATNDVHFIDKEDGPAHDRLICLTTNAYIDDPDRLHYTQQEYMKSEEEMAALFPGHPEVISNTLEVCDKIEIYKIDKDPILPKFRIPDEFLAEKDKYVEKYKDIIDVGRTDAKGNSRGEEFIWSVAYLCYLTYKGAEWRYGEHLDEVQSERIDFELKTICKMGFPDYFLIVQDFIAASRAQGISVGPGRGSAAGSAVAYCLKITNLDPIRYDLLFERFLNPDRINMPDIDIDFDDDGRYDAFKYVENTYGKDHISHVITFGTMAAKSAIKDVGRISHISIDESNRLTKMIPDKPFIITEEEDIPLNEGEEPGKGEKLIEKDGVRYKRVKVEKEKKPNLANCCKWIPELKNELENGTELNKEVLKYALKLEGSIRQTGVHACAMIIGRGDLTDYIPISMAKDKATGEDVWVSQYDGHFIEEVGMLKMDFLGLRTLSIIKECLRSIKKRHGIDIDIEKIPIDDKETYELYGRGDTTSVFQFESPGMKEWLQKLKPTRFEDLIAMNALYRPGPMDYIPQFVARKQGTEPIAYDLPEMEEYLNDTYGVTVYQEQVMLLSRKLAGFTRGQSDTLRKAMGKKIKAMLDKLHPQFIEGGMANGHPKETLEKIWADWEAFAKYAFNKSHATCYAWVSYQTGWLKAHYPAEFQAANLSKNLSSMDEIKKIMDDCKKGGIKVLNPDINESESGFSVNSEGNVRFGLGGIKGFGDNIVQAIISERESGGTFEDIFDFVERMSAIINRKSIESLALSGAFDSFGITRGQFDEVCKDGDIFMDALVRYADLYRRDNMDSAVSLFGEIEEMKPTRPEIPQPVQDEDTLKYLQKEKELVGMFLSSHPLDKYRFELDNFTGCSIGRLSGIIDEATEKQGGNSKLSVAGLVTSVASMTTKTGKPFAKAVIEDYEGSYEFAFFGNDYETFKPYLNEHEAVFIEGEVKPRFFQKPEEGKKAEAVPYTYRVQKMSLLGNVADEKIKSFTIMLSTEQITPKFRADLVNIIKDNKGKVPLNMKLFDPVNRWNIDFASRKFNVSVSNEFIETLAGLGVSTKFERKN